MLLATSPSSSSSSIGSSTRVATLHRLACENVEQVDLERRPSLAMPSGALDSENLAGLRGSALRPMVLPRGDRVFCRPQIGRNPPLITTDRRALGPRSARRVAAPHRVHTAAPVDGQPCAKYSTRWPGLRRSPRRTWSSVSIASLCQVLEPGTVNVVTMRPRRRGVDDVIGPLGERQIGDEL